MNDGVVTYFECDVNVETEDDKGKVKTMREKYIVEAMNPTEVEQKITKRLEGLEFEINNVKRTKIIEIIK